jgi:shikimate dehydrogenase
MRASEAPRIRLGLIGDNIARSRSPRLHRMAGSMCGLDVSYASLIPADLEMDFDAVFERCRAEGFRGINITYPYKETVLDKVKVDDPAVRALGACNTILFEPDGARGYNTDSSGFASAFLAAFGNVSPGRVAMAGAGGVGKAIAIALGRLGASHLALIDPDQSKSEALATSLTAHFPDLEVSRPKTLAEAVDGADGLINCTPIGMVGHDGNVFDGLDLRHSRWAFDAVYTPVETRFLAAARTAKAEILSGYELFFHQGVQAFRLFTGQEPVEAALRAAMLVPEHSEAGRA